MDTSVHFDEIEAAMNAVKLHQDPPARDAAAAAAASADGALEKLGPLYRGVRPLIVALIQTGIFPSKWKKVLKQFMSVLDLLCPPALP